MLELTVKTLDSANHPFLLVDEATVMNLKESILEKLEVPIEMQRLIFHGKVLQDHKKLTDYGDIHGKVIHLVQRAPPSLSRGSESSSRSESGTGNDGERPRSRRLPRPPTTTYIGSMAFPPISADILDGANLDLPTRPNQVMARNRLDCAKRMLGYANQSVRNMQQPQASTEPAGQDAEPAGQSTQETGTVTATENRGTTTNNTPSASGLLDDVDGVTLSSAGVSVPPTSSDDPDLVTLRTVTLIQAANGRTYPVGRPEPALMTSVGPQEVAVEVVVETDGNPAQGSSSEPEVTVNNDTETGQNREDGARSEAMVPLLSELETINTNLQPFLVRCRELLTSDATYDSSPSYDEAVRVFNGVTETLHSVAHACHALSDLMVDFHEDAPRSLRCRPVVLQHSTMIESGFPVRIPAADLDSPVNVRRFGHFPHNRSASVPQATARGQAPTPTTTASTATDASDANRPSDTTAPSAPNAGHQHHFALVPGQLEIFMDFGMDGPPISAPAPSQPPSADASAAAAAHGPPTFIAASDVPPEIQSRIQAIAGQIHNQFINSMEMAGSPMRVVFGSQGRPGSAPTSDRAATPQVTTEAATNTTTSTTTPTTAPPPLPPPPFAPPPPPPPPPRRTGAGITPPPLHDMIHSLFHGHFDPALPCNSHHIRNTRQRASPPHRLRVGLTEPPTASARVSQIPLRTYQLPRGVIPRPQGPTPSRRGVPTPAAAPPPTLLDFLTNPTEGANPGWANLPGMTSAADMLQVLSGGPVEEGSSIVLDLIMTMARNMSWVDVVELFTAQTSGAVEAYFNRIQPVLAEFATQRLLGGEDVTEDALKRACERILSDMQPYLEAMQSSRLRDSVDLSATISNYNTVQLTAILQLVTGPVREPGEFGGHLAWLLKDYIQHLFAIVLYCAQGNEGFADIVRSCVRLLTRGAPLLVQEWTEAHSVSNLNHYTSGLNVPMEEIQRYLVYRIPPPVSSSTQEAMETDGWTNQEKPEEAAAEALVAMETENLPEVLIGSESWHNSLPTEWVPVIARDQSRQRRQGSQKPFSDGYLAGMPAKRRKLIASNKPPMASSVSQNISDGVRQAIEAAGMSSSMVADAAAAVAAADPALQQAYRDQQKATARTIVTQDPDFTPNRFPNASKAFKK